MNEQQGIAFMIQKRENEARQLNLRSMQIQKELDWIHNYATKKKLKINKSSRKSEIPKMKKQLRPFPGMKSARVPPHPQSYLPQ